MVILVYDGNRYYFAVDGGGRIATLPTFGSVDEVRRFLAALCDAANRPVVNIEVTNAPHA